MTAPAHDESSPPAVSVLAVDDLPRNLMVLSVILEPLRVNLVTAASGREALRRAEEQEFAAILLDVMMPEMDGFETLARLRALRSNHETPVVLLTAHELDPQAIERVEGMGMVDYILKPIAAVILRSKVAALVALHRQREQLAAKDRHIAILAHDLQTPLAGIGVSAALMARASSEPKARVAALRIAQGVNRMAEMIRDLTDFARAGRGAIPVTPQPTDLGELCREIGRDLSEPESERFTLETNGDLRGLWDRNRLYQAVSNLVTNALRYGEGKVTLGVRAAETSVEISAHNLGAPIPESFLPVIFQPFECGAKDRAGLGLGLYIVDEIVKAHRGAVSVTSTAERGTTFVIRLPRTVGA